MPKHQSKYRFICKAPNHLTTYNEVHNEKINKHCTADKKFEPEMTCALGPLGKCSYLELKKYK